MTSRELASWIESEMLEAQRAGNERRATKGLLLAEPYQSATALECAGMAKAYARVLLKIRKAKK